jgi:hypothetical protein
MSHDLDDALRASMRRHAEDAPTSIDTDAIRLRAKGIQRRRTLESVAAVVVLLGVVLGLGALVGTLRNDATPPPAVTQTPVPGGSPLMAFTASKDGNSPLGLVVRSGGTDTVVATTTMGSGESLQPVGWFGPEHRTLVWGRSTAPYREVTLYAVTLGADGRATDSPHPLRVPGLSNLGRGLVFTGAASGSLQLWVPANVEDKTSAVTLVTIADDLASGLERPMPNGLPAAAHPGIPGPLAPVAISDTYAVLVGIDSGRVGVTTLTADRPAEPSATSACTPRLAVSANQAGDTVALGCVDGSVDLLTPADGNVRHLTPMPEAAEPGLLLGLWWDPSGGLHASTTPEARADYTVVHDWDWTGKAWVRSSDDGVLTRIYPVGSPSVRLVKKNDLPGNLGRWIVESNPEVDLGQTDGALVVAPVVAATPTPSPQPTGSAPATTLGWTATVRPSEVAGSPPAEQVWVSIDGRSALVDDASNAATSVLGWYGPDHRTLVWQTGQDLLQLRTVTFAVDGSMEGAPRDLDVPGVASPLIGVATAIPGDGLVLWHQKPGTGRPAYEMVRLDESLALHSRTPDSGGSLVFATGTTYATTATGKQPTEEILLSKGGTTTPIRLLRNCDGDLSGVPSPDGSKVALLCRGSATGQQNHVELFDMVANRADDRVLPAGNALLWWDPAGDLHASVSGVSSAVTSAPSTVRWLLASGTWGDDPGQTADLRVFPVAGPALRWTRDGAAESGSWTAETDPVIAVGPGLPSPVYGIGTGNIAVRPTS